MITAIIHNELKHNLLNLRFVMGLFFVLVVYTGESLIFCNRYLKEKEKDRENEMEYQSDIESAKDGLKSLYGRGILLAKSQQLSSFFCWGSESRIPKALVITAGAPQAASMSGGMVLGGTARNYKLENCTDLDLAFLVGVVLSFFTIVLSFDSISRDREQGTLKQQLSNSIPRVRILVGKFAAILIVLFIAVLLGSILSIIISQVLIGQVVLVSFLYETITSFAVSAIYLSVFIWLGLWISSSVSKSSTSLALLLLVWIALVVLSPYVGGMIVKRYYPVASQQVFDEQWHTVVNSQWSEMPHEYLDFIQGRGNEEKWKVVEQFFDRQTNLLEQLIVQRFMALTNQATKAESFNFFSPYGAFKQVMERIANTGLAYHIKFNSAARLYRNELAQFIRDQDRLDPQSEHRLTIEPAVRSISIKPVDPKNIPRFVPPSRHLSITDLEQSLMSVGYLVLLNVAIFVLAVFQFSRMDVR